MNHYVYQITNNINGKIYIGKRSCKCSIEDDTYFGSGTRLKYAIKKYGKENFNKTIIDSCDDVEMAYELEALIVDEDFLKRTDTYNLCGGGVGPSCMSNETKAKISANNARSWKGKTLSDESKAKISANHARHMTGKTGELNPMFGKNHSDEARAKISEANKGRVSPNKGKIRSLEAIAKCKATRLFNKLNKQNLT